jgi:hypothetical protein
VELQEEPDPVPFPETIAEPAAELPGSPPRTAAQDIQQQRALLLARMNGTPLAPPSASRPNEIKLLVPHKEFPLEGPDQTPRVTFDDIDLLKVLNMEPVPPNVMDYLPDWLKSLDGHRIILRGWMYPSFRQTGIERFMFVRDNGICCFGREPKVYDKLAVTMREGKSTNYIQGRPFDVVGTLSIQPEMDGDEVFWLYKLDDALVVDK